MINLEEKSVSSLEDSINLIQQKDFDILLTVGAGNIDTIVKPLKNWLLSEA